MNVFRARGSFRRQIVLTFVVGFFFLISAFAVYQVEMEKEHLYRDNTNDAISLAQSLSASSRSWVLANDADGLQEVLNSFRDYHGLYYAMVITPSGRVLSHTDASRVGQFLSDEKSLAFIKAAPAIRVVTDDESSVDVAVPVVTDSRNIGWARIALGRKDISANLRKMIARGAVFVVISTVWSLLAVFLIMKRLGQRIDSLIRVAEEVSKGNFNTRAIQGAREDEITLLAENFNRMLDTLGQNEKALRAASLYARSLLEASLDPLVTISSEGKITDVNEATEKATGRIRSELVGTDFSNYFTEPGKAREGYQQVFARGYVTDYPLAIRHRDGRVMDVLYNASLYRDEAGEVLGVFAAARDITERKKAENKISELNRGLELRVAERTSQLEAANRELESFSYSVSHDLRVPLRAIDGFSQIVIEEYRDKLDAEGRRLLNVVRDNTRKMAQLIDDILAFSRTGRTEMMLAEVDMEELVRNAFEELKPAGRSVSLDLKPLPPALADRAMMVRVYTNLLANAIKFTQPRQAALIEAGAYPGEEENTYYVRDNGVGFDMQYVDKLFGVFQRLHAVSEFEGTGIGLAIVKRIVARHGGRVWAEGRLDEGAIFYFTLPAKEKTWMKR